MNTYKRSDILSADGNTAITFSNQRALDLPECPVPRSSPHSPEFLKRERIVGRHRDVAKMNDDQPHSLSAVVPADAPRIMLETVTREKETR